MTKTIPALFAILASCAAAPPAAPVTALRPLGIRALDQIALDATVALERTFHDVDYQCDYETESCLEIPLPPEDRSFCAGVHIGDGRILTAAHCVEGAEEDTGGDHFWVRSREGDVSDVRVVRMDSQYDLALLDTDLDIPSLNEGYDPLVGDRVVAAGHPIGLMWTATHGHVSARRSGSGPPDDLVFDWTQVDAPIGPGNSGGPLVDRYGRLIGIASFYYPGFDFGGFVDITEIRAFLAGVPS